MVGWSKRQRVSRPIVVTDDDAVNDEFFDELPVDETEGKRVFTSLVKKDWGDLSPTPPSRMRRFRRWARRTAGAPARLAKRIWKEIAWALWQRREAQRQLDANLFRMRRLAGLVPPQKIQAEPAGQRNDISLATLQAMHSDICHSRVVRDELPKPDYIDEDSGAN